MELYKYQQYTTTPYIYNINNIKLNFVIKVHLGVYKFAVWSKSGSSIAFLWSYLGIKWHYEVLWGYQRQESYKNDISATKAQYCACAYVADMKNIYRNFTGGFYNNNFIGGLICS